MIKQFTMRVNGADTEVSTEDNIPLLYVLRNELNLKGARFGCGEGYCGACTVILNGRAVQSCTTPISSVMDAEITTIECAMNEVGGNLKLQKIAQCFIDEQAAQCGYCIPGIILSAYSNGRYSCAVITRNAHPRFKSFHDDSPLMLPYDENFLNLWLSDASPITQ